MAHERARACGHCGWLSLRRALTCEGCGRLSERVRRTLAQRVFQLAVIVLVVWVTQGRTGLA